LAISAHPDDVEFTSGGSQDPAVVPAELAVVRQAEQWTAARVLGIADVTCLGYPDGELSRALDLVETLARHIRRLRPDQLVSWDPWKPYQLHPDHRAAGLAALDAILAAGNPHYFPHQLVNSLSPHQVPEVYLYGAAEPDTWVDITATFGQKMAAIFWAKVAVMSTHVSGSAAP